MILFVCSWLKKYKNQIGSQEKPEEIMYSLISCLNYLYYKMLQPVKLHKTRYLFVFYTLKWKKAAISKE